MTRNASPARTAQSLGRDSACPLKFGVLRVLRGLKFSVLLESRQSADAFLERLPSRRIDS